METPAKISKPDTIWIRKLQMLSCDSLSRINFDFLLKFSKRIVAPSLLPHLSSQDGLINPLQKLEEQNLSSPTQLARPRKKKNEADFSKGSLMLILNLRNCGRPLQPWLEFIHSFIHFLMCFFSRLLTSFTFN